jgi:hypothetical protein
MNTFQVFLAAIAGYVPSAMVRCIASFMDACYITHRNAINTPALEQFCDSVEQFHLLCNIFIETGVQATISLPCQHALKHFHLVFESSVQFQFCTQKVQNWNWNWFYNFLKPLELELELPVPVFYSA